MRSRTLPPHRSERVLVWRLVGAELNSEIEHQTADTVGAAVMRLKDKKAA
jgi:hypothetical protein